MNNTSEGMYTRSHAYLLENDTCIAACQSGLSRHCCWDSQLFSGKAIEHAAVCNTVRGLKIRDMSSVMRR